MRSIAPPQEPFRLHQDERRLPAVEKKSTMDTYWVPGVNHLGTYGRWALAEFTEVYQIESEFKAKVDGEFARMIEGVVPK